LRRDFPVVNAAVLLASTMVVAGNLLADVLLAIADPRLRVRAGGGEPA
jgi:peptide/nickel transport system permease protein